MRVEQALVDELLGLGELLVHGHGGRVELQVLVDHLRGTKVRRPFASTQCAALPAQPLPLTTTSPVRTSSRISLNLLCMPCIGSGKVIFQGKMPYWPMTRPPCWSQIFFSAAPVRASAAWRDSSSASTPPCSVPNV